MFDFSTPVGYQNPVWAKAGRELRELADAFNKTMERRRVRERAHQVRPYTIVTDPLLIFNKRKNVYVLGFNFRKHLKE